MKRSPDNHELFVKVVVAGAAGCGKRSILEALAERYGAESLGSHEIGSMRVQRAAWTDWEVLGDGRALHIAVLALDGKISYNASEELLLREADGIIFVIDVEPTKLQGAWDALLRVSDNAQSNGYDLRSVPFALQYHRADRHKDFEPTKLDQWLGVPNGEVPRFVTSSSSPDLEGMAFDAVLDQIVKRLLGSTKSAECVTELPVAGAG